LTRHVAVRHDDGIALEEIMHDGDGVLSADDRVAKDS